MKHIRTCSGFITERCHGQSNAHACLADLANGPVVFEVLHPHIRGIHNDHLEPALLHSSRVRLQQALPVAPWQCISLSTLQRTGSLWGAASCREIVPCKKPSFAHSHAVNAVAKCTSQQQGDAHSSRSNAMEYWKGEAEGVTWCADWRKAN